jgi:hypothetical protein
MALKIALPKAPALALPRLADKRAMALAQARFKAWWDGKDFNAEAFAADLPPEDAPALGERASDEDLFEPALTPDEIRLGALQRIWGKGRIMPGENGAEALHVARLGAPATGTIGLFGPGLIAPVTGLSEAHPGPIHVFEWREEAQASLKRAIEKGAAAKRTSLVCIDLETFPAQAGALDGLISNDEFTHSANPARLAQQFAKLLKPDAVGVIETYCAAKGTQAASAFASAFLETHLRPADEIEALLSEVGFRVEGDDDISEEHVALAREGFQRLGKALEAAGALDALMARELAWEAEAWRMRVRMLGAQRLERRLFTVTRRG